MIDRFYAKFEKFAAQNRLFVKSQTILAAISGGADSMVMLDLLHRYSVKHNKKLHGLHVHHGLRGKLADADQQLVEESCQAIGIDCFTSQVDVKRYAEEHGVSLEMAGRALRYAFFDSVAEQFSDSVIATAHTLDDHVETILLHFIKGCGVNGLCGIPIRRQSIVRPIRFLTKEEIYRYAKTRAIRYHEDHTNRQNHHERNLLRNQIVPLIEQINPSFSDACHKISLAAGEIKSLVDGIAKDAFGEVLRLQKRDAIGLDIEQLTHYPDVIKKAILHLSLERLYHGAAPLNFAEQQQYLDILSRFKSGASLPLRGSIGIYIDREHLIIRKRSEQSWSAIPVQGEGVYENDHFRLSIIRATKAEPKTYADDRNTELVDADTVRGECILRPWKRGDKIRLLGSGRHKKLSDVFIDQKIPHYQKNLIPILVCNSEIIWICGMRLSEKFKITKETKTIYRLQYEEKDV